MANFATYRKQKTLGCTAYTYSPTLEPKIKRLKKELTFAESEKTAQIVYLYGFNGMEKDDEIKGSGNSYDFGARIYDPRLGRWLAIDPLAKLYTGLSPYNFVDNNPCRLVDADGRVITIPDGKGGFIVYTPGMKSDGFSEVTKKHINYLNNMYGGEAKARMDKLTASEVEYHIEIGSKKEVGLQKGGVTTYDFKKQRVLIKIAEDGNLTYAMLGDEFTHAVQFDEGELGFIKVSGGVASVGYDLQDEIESKRGAVDALKQKGLNVADLDPKNKYESTAVMKHIEQGTDVSLRPTTYCFK